MLTRTNDTLAAISTPPGQGGIAVIRVSGPKSWESVLSVFEPESKFTVPKPNRVIYGRLHDNHSPIDQVLVTFFRAPKSYTGEDMAEVSCHGGRFVAEKILMTLLATGARAAGPGEFTRRAFMNGKMDLVQAEAVAALIRADTERASRSALQELNGVLSSRFKALADEIREMLALVEVNIDFTDQDIALFDFSSFSSRTKTLLEKVKSLAATYKQGRFIAEGIRVALIGPPNAGKSSLFNALCEKERVIVDEHPGTTRDLVEETIALEGYRVTLMDTAGIRNTDNRVENKGIELAKQAAMDADLCILVFDGTDRQHIGKLRPDFDAISSRERIEVMNKCDLSDAKSGQALCVSAKTRQGLDALKQAILKTISQESDTTEGAAITSARHREGLDKCALALELLADHLEQRTSEEILALDLRDALNALSRITGAVTDDDILNDIFSRFCIGK